MNDAKKIREIESLYFTECKENESNKILLNRTQQQYNHLRELCEKLLNIKTTNDYDIIINAIEYHLKHY